MKNVLTALICMAGLLVRAEEPKPLKVMDYRPQGLLPSDLRAFLNSNARNLTPIEKGALEQTTTGFEKSWKEFQVNDEFALRQALANLGSPDPATLAQSRNKVIEVMTNRYSSSFTVYRDCIKSLHPENQVRLTEFNMDFRAAREIWLKNTRDMLDAVKPPDEAKRKFDALYGAELNGSIAIRRESLPHCKNWVAEVKAQPKPDPAPTLAVSRVMDYYERFDARGMDNVITAAPKTLGEDIAKKMQLQVLERMPKRPTVTAN